MVRGRGTGGAICRPRETWMITKGGRKTDRNIKHEKRKSKQNVSKTCVAKKTRNRASGDRRSEIGKKKRGV